MEKNEPTPIIKTRGLVRKFGKNETETTVLDDLDIEINTGEMVAIIGPSGSGKSTLMNILGCIDSPTDGDVWIDGKNTQYLSHQEMSLLRRERIGFIFQQYHLLNDLSARENVMLPAVYSGENSASRLKRADKLLERLGLSEYKCYKPNNLSGGQQQRVSIARALINGGRIIFADEPTGALDSDSGKEVMQILHDLHNEGHTVVIITHDPDIASCADRIIELKDGRIVGEEIKEVIKNISFKPRSSPADVNTFNFIALYSAFLMAINAILRHKLRAFLSVFGVVIGISSVIVMVAIGQGSQKKSLDRLNQLGPNVIKLYPGKFYSRHSHQVKTLKAEDAIMLSQQSFVSLATPIVKASTALRYQKKELNAAVKGIGMHYFQIYNFPILEGRGLTKKDIDQHSNVGYISSRDVKKIFGNDSPIGKVVLLDNMPLTIVGIADDSGQNKYLQSREITMWAPHTAILSRLLGETAVSSITLQVPDHIDINVAENKVKNVLSNYHGIEDFTLENYDSLRKMIAQSVKDWSQLILAIGIISLVVSGIGIMNVMLIAVKERTQEIGIRMAIGAKRTDIMYQFIIEACVLCFVGAIIGITLTFGLGKVFTLSNYNMIYSMHSAVIAVLFAVGSGLLFGYLPAKNASRVSPVEALTRG